MKVPPKSFIWIFHFLNILIRAIQRLLRRWCCWVMLGMICRALPTLQNHCGVALLSRISIWWFPEIGLSPVIIHSFDWDFPWNQPSSYWGNPFFRKPNIWLVVWTPLKNLSQLGWVFSIYGKIKHVPTHQPAIYFSHQTQHCPKTMASSTCGTSCCCRTAWFGTWENVPFPMRKPRELNKWSLNIWVWAKVI